MNKSDIAYYVSYIIVLLMAGIWLLAWALGAIPLGEAFMFWLLSIGILLVVIGAIGTSASRGASSFQINTGLVLSIVVLIVLAVTSDILGGFVGAAIGIILIGLVGLLMLLRNIRQEA
jgi:hypothetical protein